MTLCTPCWNYENMDRPSDIKYTPSLDDGQVCGKCRNTAAEERERMNYPNLGLTFNEYQELSKETAIGYADPNPDGETMHRFHSLFLAVAINGEAGELGEKVKKYVRENDEDYLEGARAELGDVLWYLAQLATLLDVSLDGVAEANLDKLLDRQERGQITGSGDNR